MKTLMAMVAVSSSLLFVAAQQDTPPTTPPAQPPPPLQQHQLEIKSLTPLQEMQAEREKNMLRIPSRAKTSTNGEIVFTSSGFLADLAKTNKPFQMISLRQPMDKKRDGQNLVRDPLDQRVIGVKLFSLDF